MFCVNCGKQIIENSKFCSECGAPVNQQSGYKQENYQKTVKNTNELLLVLKPVFISWPVIVQTIPFQIFFTLWGALFLGGFTTLGLSALVGSPGQNVFGWYPFAFWGILFFVMVPIVSYFGTKLNYNYATYKFYGSKLEYSESFLKKEIKSINYNKILEVTLSKGIIQQGYGLGTIVLSTAATTNSMRGSGIRIPDIENPDEVYHTIKQLIEQHQ